VQGNAAQDDDGEIIVLLIRKNIQVFISGAIPHPIVVCLGWKANNGLAGIVDCPRRVTRSMNSVGPVQVKLQDTDSRKRPRDQPKPKPKPKPTAKPRRRTRSFGSEAGWYTIRDIIDEKVEDGRIQYLIDWEGTDNNGVPYDPTWVRYARQSSVIYRARD
jgi:hypothetical protein